MANMLGIDPKKFKHVHSNEHSTTLQHKDGHLLRIAHNVLNPEMKAQLKSLSKMTVEARTSDQAQEAQQQQPDKKLAKGGRIEHQNEHPEIPMQPYDTPMKDGGKVGKYCPHCGQMAHGGDCEQHYDFGGTVSKALNSMTAPAKEYDVRKIGQDTEDKRKQAPESDSEAARRMQAQPRDPYADGGDVAPEQSQEEPASGGELGKKLRDVLAGYKPVQQADAILHLAGKAATAVPGFIKGMTGGYDKPAEQAPTAAPTQPPTPQPQAQSQQQAPVQAPSQQPAAPVDTAVSDANGKLQQGYGNQVAAQKALVPAIQQKSESEVNALGLQQAQQQDFQTDFKKNYNSLMNERQQVWDDMNNNHIDPEKYWTGDKNGDGSHSKIMSGLGIILAGFNPTNHPNAAIDFLNHQMDRNLQAQEAEMGKKNNLLTANFHQFGNMKMAADMTMLQQAMLLENQMKQAAAEAATPMAKAAMLDNIGKLQQEYGPKMMQMGLTQTLMNLGKGGTSVPGSTGHALGALNALDPEKGKDYQSKYYAPFDIPGGKSIADRPISPSDRTTIDSHDKLTTAATTLKQFISKHGGLWDRMSPGDRAIAAQLVLPVQAAFREGTLGTVYREGEQPLLDKAIKGQPLEMAQYFLKTEPKKLDQLMRSNEAAKSVLLKNYGLTPPQSQQQQQQNDMVTVISPKGVSGKIPRANLQKALQQGYKAQ